MCKDCIEMNKEDDAGEPSSLHFGLGSAVVVLIWTISILII